jgi:hypothetical protein
LCMHPRSCIIFCKFGGAGVKIQFEKCPTNPRIKLHIAYRLECAEIRVVSSCLQCHSDTTMWIANPVDWETLVFVLQEASYDFVSNVVPEKAYTSRSSGTGRYFFILVPGTVDSKRTPLLIGSKNVVLHDMPYNKNAELKYCCDRLCCSTPPGLRRLGQDPCLAPTPSSPKAPSKGI